MIIVGIDPGLNGAIASIDGDDVRIWDLPVAERVMSTKTKAGNPKVRRSIDAERLARMLGNDVLDNFLEPADAIVFVEWAQASPGISPVAAFNYGEGFGLIRGVLAHLGVPMRLVRSSVWKKALGLTRPKGERDIDDATGFGLGDKDAALELARKLYPGIGHGLRLKGNDGRAEALLIAHYGCEQLEEERGAA